MEDIEMIIKGGAYTNENKVDDANLLTDLEPDEQLKVGGWIRNNIRAGRIVMKGHSSYGLKHILERDTGIYMTNNQFKDAMLLAGHKPVNPRELNWHFRIVLVREVNYNPSPFVKWVLKYLGKHSPEGDFADDVKNDFEFPVFAEYSVIKNYLEYIGACDRCQEIFEELWKAYERENS
jgi:uncharacterized protein YozE (UPF0346 family)